MDKTLIAMSGIKILIMLMFIGMGIIFAKGYGADFITLFDENKHNREKFARIFGKIMIISSLVMIIITVIDCILSV
ncbi:MAG: hypothetical protein RSD22_05685 [Romboutsia sp.]